ncbi:MAG: CvpA family protein [Bacillota bacterium]|nr:CvpA family protein [Bacillota bacterium]
MKILINWLDIFLLIILALHLVNGLLRGLVKVLFDIIGFLVVILLSLWGSRLFSDKLAVYINPEDIIPHHELIQTLGLEVALERVPQLVAGIIAFLLLFLLLSLVFRLFSGGFRWVNRVPVIGFFNRIGGGLVGIAIGLAFVYIIIAALSFIPIQFFMDALDNSEVVFIANHYISPLAHEIKELVVDFYLSLNT